MKRIIVISAVIAGVGLVVWYALTQTRHRYGELSLIDTTTLSLDEGEGPHSNRRSGNSEVEVSSATRFESVTDLEEDELKDGLQMTPERLKEVADEAAVESFDNLTDRWMEPSENGVAMADVDAFVAQFRKLPPARKEECLQRALNLVPDENVMLLAGVLMDKSQPKELVELVFNDFLNRDEAVKKPVLQQIFKDKTHPCWADTAWILDVTGDVD